MANVIATPTGSFLKLSKRKKIEIVPTKERNRSSKTTFRFGILKLPNRKQKIPSNKVRKR